MHFDASQVRSEDGADQSQGLRQGSTGDDGGLNLMAPATRSVHPLWTAQNLSGKEPPAFWRAQFDSVMENESG